MELFGLLLRKYLKRNEEITSTGLILAEGTNFNKNITNRGKPILTGGLNVIPLFIFKKPISKKFIYILIKR